MSYADKPIEEQGQELTHKDKRELLQKGVRVMTMEGTNMAINQTDWLLMAILTVACSIDEHLAKIASRQAHA